MVFDDEGCYVPFFEDTGFAHGRPYVDVLTRNLVLQELQPVEDHSTQQRWESMAIDLDNLRGQKTQMDRISDKDAEVVSKRIKTIIEEKGPAFRYTPEFFRVIADERERQAAYKAIVLTGVPNAEELDIQLHPFRYLGLPDDATFDQVRASYISLSRIYHPDVVNPQNIRQRELIFGNGQNLTPDQSIEEFLKSLKGKTPPAIKTVAEIDELSEEQRTEYLAGHEAYRRLERQYEDLKQDMRTRATKKMQIITKAYRAAKDKFSKSITAELGGFEWEHVIEQSDFLKALGAEGFEHQRLGLEGDGEIRRDTGKFNSDREIYLGYDYGEAYLGGPDYMQRLPLKRFFAWVELRQKRELSPLLLDDVVDQYKFGHDQAEQFRIMLMNRELPNFIVQTLGVPEPKGYEANPLKWFVESVLTGPEFVHQTGPRSYRGYRLGVEITPEGGLVLKYRTQESEYNFWCGRGTERTAHFTPEDMKVMTIQAYGPLLAELNRI